jgi:hypothetical protein
MTSFIGMDPGRLTHRAMVFLPLMPVGVVELGVG